MTDPRQPVVVIFGAAVRPDGSPSPTLLRRVQAAAVFARGLSEPLFLPTGAAGPAGPTEASVMCALLRQFGVPPERLLPEETGRDTLSSVRAVRRLLAARRHRGPVYAATSAYHLPRCLALLRLAGLRARACKPPPWPAARRWHRRWFWRLRELLALPYDAALILGLRLAGRL